MLPGFPPGFDGKNAFGGEHYYLRWYLMYPGRTYSTQHLDIAHQDLAKLAHALAGMQGLNLRKGVDYSTPYARNLARTIVKLERTFHHHGAHARKLRARELHAERSAARHMLPASP